MRRVVIGGLMCLALLPFAGGVRGQDDKKNFGIECRIIYVPTPKEVVAKMLDMAKVKEADKVFDLGCGDGRVVAMAAKKYKAKAVGVDIDPERIKDSAETLKK